MGPTRTWFPLMGQAWSGETGSSLGPLRCPSVTTRHQLWDSHRVGIEISSIWLNSQCISLAMEPERWMSPSPVPLSARVRTEPRERRWQPQIVQEERCDFGCMLIEQLGRGWSPNMWAWPSSWKQLQMVGKSQILVWEDWVLFRRAASALSHQQGHCFLDCYLPIIWNNLTTSLQRDPMSKRWLGVWV